MRLRTVWIETNLWGVEFLLWPAPIHHHTDCYLRFHKFSQCPFYIPKLSRWLVWTSLFQIFFLSLQGCACLLSALLTSFPSSACERLCPGCRYITSVFLESFPTALMSVSSLPHYFIPCRPPQSTSASKANGDSELTMLCVHPSGEIISNSV